MFPKHKEFMGYLTALRIQGKRKIWNTEDSSEEETTLPDTGYII